MKDDAKPIKEMRKDDDEGDGKTIQQPQATSSSKSIAKGKATKRKTDDRSAGETKKVKTKSLMNSK